MNILFIQSISIEQGSMFKIKRSLLEPIKKALKGVQISIAQQSSKNFDKKIVSADIVIAPAVENIDLEKAKVLKWVHITSAGANRIPEELMESDILITNSSGVHPVPISEQVLGYMLLFSRSIYKAYRIQIEKKTWIRNYDLLQVSELAGKTVGIIGMGRIGERIAKLCKAFDMQIIGVTRTKKRKGKFVDSQLTSKGLDKILGSCDYVVNSLPATKETTQIFNMQRFKKFKKGAVYINIGRGGTTNEDDLIDVLRSGYLKGAALDVFEEEPLKDSSELWKLENVLITSHYSGWTPKYMERVIGIFCENLNAYLNNKVMPNLIDKKLGY